MADQSCERQVGEFTAFAERSGFEVKGIFGETASGARNNRLARTGCIRRRPRPISSIVSRRSR